MEVNSKISEMSPWFLISLHLFMSLMMNAEAYTVHPDTYLNIVQLIQRYGYPVEVHEITTKDDYKLTMFRIPHGRGGSGVNRKPILLMHGLYGQAENFVVSGMDNASLAYYLADNNFDVWLGNTRGNQHSRKHRYLNPDEKKFWEFSYHEIGIYDLPAKIDHILETTKKKKIYYVGHSQGGTSFYIMSSERPEYQEKIVMASLLAPAGFMKHFRNPVLFPLVKMYRSLVQFFDTYFYELPPRSIPLPTFLNLICQERYFNKLCLAIYHIIINGGNSGEFNRRMLPLIMRFIPSVSVRQPLHYAQAIMSGRFRMWDYGQENMVRYKRIEPPEYDLKNITVPIAIYYSYGDNLVDTKDIDYICEVLPNVVRKYLMPNPKWTHLDFIFAVNGQKHLHTPLLKFLEKFDKND
ncbi:lipase 1-like [Coccinella septempunctata]|uniref:lipase 1-like n=1 Tax=Coccinella septempunctata TaxID=41139 RepID=UPI001D085C98|nr:lipase 1-like [Coccinella septempunctata]